MIFACEIGRPGKKLFTDTLATMLRRDDETSDPANRRAVWKIWDEFGANQADDLKQLVSLRSELRRRWRTSASFDG